MAATIYPPATPDERLAEAQRTLETHVTSGATGRCLACGTPGPCDRRETAVEVFSRLFASAAEVVQQHLPDAEGWCGGCLRLWGRLAPDPCTQVRWAATIHAAYTTATGLIDAAGYLPRAAVRRSDDHVVAAETRTPQA